MASSSGVASDRIGTQIANLALQRGLITQDEWAEALGEFKRQRSAPDGNVSLATILIDRGFLSSFQVEELRRAADTHPRRTDRLTRRRKASPGEPVPFGRYLLLREVGRGGRGVVYEALDTKNDTRVALKLIRNNPDASPEEASKECAWFSREARFGARLPAHPNLVRVRDSGVIDGRRYLKMDLVQGVEFDRWLGFQDGIRVKVEKLREIAVALHQAHEHGVLHRDLKPRNILVDSEGVPRLTDFGTARFIRSDSRSSLTSWGQAVGTAAYMSPEQAQASESVDRRTDIYSLGVMLYEILADRTPFDGETAFETIMKAMTREAEPPSKVAAEAGKLPVDTALEAICQKAMARDPQDRYETALDFANALEAWRRGSRSALPLSKRRSLALAAVGVALLAAAAVGVILWRPAEPTAKPASAPRVPAPVLTKTLNLTPERASGIALPEDAQVVERAGSLAYLTIPTQHGTGTLPLDLDDAWSAGAAIAEVEIEFFDANEEAFYLGIQYDSNESRLHDEGRARWAKTFWLTGTETWRTVRVVLPDPRFENRLGGTHDLRLYSKEADLAVRRVTVRALTPSDAAPLRSGFLKALSDAPTGLNPGLLSITYAGQDFAEEIGRRVDPWVAHDWGSASGPHGRADDFSVRWTGFLKIERTATYLIAVNSDNGARLRLNGELIVNNWTPHAADSDLVRCTLEAGLHAVEVDYFEVDGRASITWACLEERDGRMVDVTSNALFHRP